ncbi:MAG: pyridoxal phosphate-dependent aminotransferase family protein [Planctomycetota bacterium]
MNRSRPAFEATTATTVTRDGIELLAFHGCGYLGLAHEASVVAAARDALERYGASGLASRTTSGNLDLHERLEERLADHLGVEAALVVPDGYLADLAAVAGLGAKRDTALIDSGAHPSLYDAARAAGFAPVPYGEGDVSHAFALLDRAGGQNVLVLTDGAFAMDGRLAPLPDLLRALPPEGVLVVDDCHGVGVLGDRGAGTVESFGLSDERLVVTGSLGKALGAGGGFVAGSAANVERVRSGAASFIGTTSLAPPAAAAALRSLEILDAEPERLERLRANTGSLHRSARRLGIRSTGTFLPVLRVPFTRDEDARRVSAALHVEGIYAPAIRYVAPADGDADEARTLLRIAVTSEHTAAELRRLEESLQRHLPE